MFTPTEIIGSYETDVISISAVRLDDVAELPALITPAILTLAELDHVVETRTRHKFRSKLREQWTCNQPHHDICWQGPDNGDHIPLSDRDVEKWVDQLVSDLLS
jgi:hypothetical protein